MKTNRWLAVVVASVLMIGMSGSAFAQAQGGNRGQNNNNGGRQRGNFDPAQMRERYMNQIKEQLGSPDDEWKLIQPRLEKVLNAQRETRSSRGGFGNRGGRTRGGNNGDTTPTTSRTLAPRPPSPRRPMTSAKPSKTRAPRPKRSPRRSPPSTKRAKRPRPTSPPPRKTCVNSSAPARKPR